MESWPKQRPKDTVIATAPSFGDFLLEQGITMMTQPPQPEINMGGGSRQKKKEATKKEEDTGNKGSLKGKAPETFNGDWTKSKEFLSELHVYFQLNRKKPNVKNCYSRVLLALSFIKGPNVVNWTKAQFDEVEKNLHNLYGGDEEDEGLWTDFLKCLKRTYVSTTQKEDAYVKMQKFKMKFEELDKYITKHSTLVSELGWDQDSNMSWHSFREGLPPPLARRIIEMEGMSDSLIAWVRHAQTYHARWAMAKAYGYTGKKDDSGKGKPKWNPHKKPKEAPEIQQLFLMQETRAPLTRMLDQKGHYSRGQSRRTP